MEGVAKENLQMLLACAIGIESRTEDVRDCHVAIMLF